jgi:hypothetical protein
MFKEIRMITIWTIHHDYALILLTSRISEIPFDALIHRGRENKLHDSFAKTNSTTCTGSNGESCHLMHNVTI